MPWLRFTDRFEWEALKNRLLYVYKPNRIEFVTTECARLAVEAGAAEYCRKPEGAKTPKMERRRVGRKTN